MNIIKQQNFLSPEREIKYLMIEPTNHCNLDCMGCNRRDVIKLRPLTHLPIEQYQNILDKLEGQPILETKLQGLGETFFHPKIHEFFSRFKDKFPNGKTITFTNGQYTLRKNNKLTSIGKRFEKSLDNLDVLLISCDGWAESYTRHKFPGDWSVFLKFLDDVGKYDIVRTSNIKVGLQMIVWEDNYDDIKKVHSLVKKYDWLDELRLNIFQWWGENDYASDLITTDMDGKTIKADYEFEPDFYDELRKWKDSVSGKASWNFSDCWWPNNGLYVESNGDVKMCCLNTDSSPSGNILKESLDDVLNHPKRNKVSYECENNIAGDHCKTCSYKELGPILEKIGVNP